MLLIDVFMSLNKVLDIVGIRYFRIGYYFKYIGILGSINEDE